MSNNLRNALSFLLILFLLLLISLPLTAQQITKGHRTQQRIEFKGYTLTESSLLIEFKVPYGGMVEFSLFNSEGKEVYSAQANRDRGDGRIALRRSALKEDEVYSYRFRYKLSELKGTIPEEMALK